MEISAKNLIGTSVHQLRLIATPVPARRVFEVVWHMGSLMTKIWIWLFQINSGGLVYGMPKYEGLSIKGK